MRNAYKTVIGKSVWKRPDVTCGCSQYDNAKMGVHPDVTGFRLDTDVWPAPVNTEMKLQVP